MQWLRTLTASWLREAVMQWGSNAESGQRVDTIAQA